MLNENDVDALKHPETVVLGVTLFDYNVGFMAKIKFRIAQTILLQGCIGILI